jgi:DNA polymerase
VGGHILQQMVNNNSGEFKHGVMYGPDGFVLPNGLPLKYHGLHQKPDGFEYVNDARIFREMVKARVLGTQISPANWTKIYSGKVIENITQALARIVVTEQLLLISTRYKVVLQVHDEIVIVCKASEVAEAKAFMIAVMSTPPAWAPDLPVACEAASGATYGDCK